MSDDLMAMVMVMPMALNAGWKPPQPSATMWTCRSLLRCGAMDRRRRRAIEVGFCNFG
jgi:hypothetical protein